MRPIRFTAAALSLCTLCACGEDVELLDAGEYKAQLEALVEEGQPEGANGYPLIIRAGQRAREVRDEAFAAWEAADGEWADEPISSLDNIRFGPYPHPDNEAGLALLAAYREAGVFDLIDQAATCPRFVAPPADDPWADEFPDPGQQAFHLGIKLPAVMRVAWHERDADRVLEAFERAMVMARAFGWQTDSLQRMRAYGFASLALREVCQQLIEDPYEDAACARLLGAIDRSLPLPPVERCIRALPFELRWLAASDAAQFRDFAETSLGTLENVDAACAAALEEVGRPVSARAREGAGYQERVLAAMASRGGMFEDREALDEAYREIPLIEHVVGSLSRLLDNDTALSAEVAATRIMLSIERYRARHGHFPEGLGALVPEFMDAIPADPAHGGGFVYRLVEGDEHGRAYVLYSTGPDGVDDGGRMSEGMWTMGFASTPDGFDYDFTAPRRARE